MDMGYSGLFFSNISNVAERDAQEARVRRFAEDGEGLEDIMNDILNEIRAHRYWMAEKLLMAANRAHAERNGRRYFN